MIEPLKWWQTAVFYQIYPRSFADGNGDGIGDLEGMTARLDYLKDLGVDALWLSPHYPSPMKDCGYDIASYVDVAPEYGSLDDFRRFLDAAHQRGMRVVLDLVLNHTSDQHAWFQESRSSRDNPKRDWYVWRDGKDGAPPNNWFSTFGGPAWEYDPATGQYYYHFFFKEQPDLNWSNPEVVAAMWDVVRFWLDMGVDGFRLDAIGTIFEEPGMPDQTTGKTLDEQYVIRRTARSAEERAYAHQLWEDLFIGQHDMPGMHELMRDLRRVVDEYPDRVLIGETDDISYYGSGSDELHLVFNFPLMRTDRLTPQWVRENQDLRLAALPAGAWPCNTLGNHDSPRMYSHFGDGKHNGQIARLNLALLLTLKGTPVLYNGEEIGMGDYLIMDVSKFRDPLGNRSFMLETELLQSPPEEALVYAALNGRDKCRTPFQWENAPNGGFCPEGVEPWLPVNPNYTEGVNLAEQQDDQGSLFQYYRRLLRVRRENPALIHGGYELEETQAENCLVFRRAGPEQICLVALNFGEQEQPFCATQSARLVYSSAAGSGPLAPFEVRILEL